MTFKEKLQQEHPEYVDKQYYAGCKGCPHNYGYEEKESVSTFCKRTNCTECWNREMPESEEKTMGKTYEQGLQDAWKLASKIFDYDKEERVKIFGDSEPVFFKWILDFFTPQEALAKLEAYEQEK